MSIVDVHVRVPPWHARAEDIWGAVISLSLDGKAVLTADGKYRCRDLWVRNSEGLPVLSLCGFQYKDVLDPSLVASLPPSEGLVSLDLPPPASILIRHTTSWRNRAQYPQEVRVRI